MPLVRFPTPAGLVYTIDLSKIADRENPRTVEAPIVLNSYPEPVIIDWGDGTVESLTGGAWPEHTYAEGTGDVFTVTLRSVTGHMSRINFNGGDSHTVAPTKNLSYAVISVDHFAVDTGTVVRSGGYLLRNCMNVKYIDTRLASSPYYDSFFAAFTCYPVAGNSSLEQPIGSFCFDFCSGCSGFTVAFYRAVKIHGDIPEGFFDNVTLVNTFEAAFQNTGIESVPATLFDKCQAITSLASVFRKCEQLKGAPYIFWKADGSLDTDKLPNLANGVSAYLDCSADIRAQVPTAYGGTMTVS